MKTLILTIAATLLTFSTNAYSGNIDYISCGNSQGYSYYYDTGFISDKSSANVRIIVLGDGEFDIEYNYKGGAYKSATKDDNAMVISQGAIKSKDNRLVSLRIAILYHDRTDVLVLTTNGVTGEVKLVQTVAISNATTFQASKVMVSDCIIVPK